MEPENRIDCTIDTAAGRMRYTAYESGQVVIDDEIDVSDLLWLKDANTQHVRDMFLDRLLDRLDKAMSRKGAQPD